ncbi:hypothetical protein IJT17_01395 [bacterium]|nr:hypothetical protein [bacterium]
MSNRGNGRKNRAVSTEKKTDPKELQQVDEMRSQMVLAVVGFAAFGFLVGFLWGANHMVAEVHSSSPLYQAAKVGCLVAINTADFGRGALMGVIGSCLGGAFGYSLFLPRR